MHVLSGKEFQIGLTMSGAISAGAYTAGVLDFLIDALDAWEVARRAADGDAIPNHRVGLKVMSGASAGAITAAIGAVAFAEAGVTPGEHVKDGFTYRYYLPRLYEALSRSRGLLVNSAGHSQPVSLNINVLGRSSLSQIGSEVAYSWPM